MEILITLFELLNFSFLPLLSTVDLHLKHAKSHHLFICMFLLTFDNIFNRVKALLHSNFQINRCMVLSSILSTSSKQSSNRLYFALKRLLLLCETYNIMRWDFMIYFINKLHNTNQIRLFIRTCSMAEYWCNNDRECVWNTG
jgi:hypothetical protein